MLNVPYEDGRIKWAVRVLPSKGTKMLQECKAGENVIGSMGSNHLLRDCAERCLGRAGCNEFTWDKGTDYIICYLSKKPVDKLEAIHFHYEWVNPFDAPDQPVDDSCIRGSVITKPASRVKIKYLFNKRRYHFLTINYFPFRIQ